MAHLAPSLRKAAVLIAALDDASADAILRQMSDDDAAKVRSALVELNDIPTSEQQQVLAEFFRQHDEPTTTAVAPGDVQLDLDPAVEAAAASYESKPAQATEPFEAEAALSFLEHVDPQAIAGVLRGEHPQTAAVVVSHLPPRQAAAVLEVLPAAFATEALERIAAIDAIAPEVLADLARALRQRLAPHLRVAKAGAASLSHLAAVWEAMDYRQRQRMLIQLGETNNPLLKCLGLFPAAASTESANGEVTALRYRLDSRRSTVHTPSQETPRAEKTAENAWLTFDDLSLLSDAALRTVIAAADPELSLLALTGAEPRLIARILRKAPARDAAALRQRLEHPGAVRLRDIEQGRAALAAVANRLAHEGNIDLPPSLRFAAAV